MSNRILRRDPQQQRVHGCEYSTPYLPSSHNNGHTWCLDINTHMETVQQIDAIDIFDRVRRWNASSARDCFKEERFLFHLDLIHVVHDLPDARHRINPWLTWNVGVAFYAPRAAAPAWHFPQT